MSAVVRDVWRYHHWPTQKSFWSRQYTSPGILTHRSAPEVDTQPQGVSGDYVGYDHKISPQNLERVRYHHWPERRHKRNPIWENESPRNKNTSVKQVGTQFFTYVAPNSTNNYPSTLR
uniref:Uncharacterized protein n=1 Tax=Magallana gigas TaxID=29159 RepID=K1QBA0_MAGGI